MHIPDFLNSMVPPDTTLANRSTSTSTTSTGTNRNASTSVLVPLQVVRVPLALIYSGAYQYKYQRMLTHIHCIKLFFGHRWQLDDNIVLTILIALHTSTVPSYTM